MKILHQYPEKTIHNSGPASNYEDEKKFALLQNQENLNLFLNTQVVDVKKNGNKISGTRKIQKIRYMFSKLIKILKIKNNTINL